MIGKFEWEASPLFNSSSFKTVALICLINLSSLSDLANNILLYLHSCHICSHFIKKFYYDSKNIINRPKLNETFNTCTKKDLTLGKHDIFFMVLVPTIIILFILSILTQMETYFDFSNRRLPERPTFSHRFVKFGLHNESSIVNCDQLWSE